MGFPPNLGSYFFKKNLILAMNSLLTLIFTSMTIYVQPPRFFVMDRISLMTTLP